jgi:hypothetical protein
LNDILPLPGSAGYGTVLRSLRTPFLTEWGGKREAAKRDRERLLERMMTPDHVSPLPGIMLPAGQTAGGVQGLLPVADIMRQLLAETEAALLHAPRMT